jgi:hypothetical protein
MRRLVFGLAVSAAWAIASPAAAQQPPPPGLPTPRINNVFPAGAQAGAAPRTAALFGATFPLTGVVTVTGFDLDEPTGLLFSHPGITGEYLPPRPAAPDSKRKDPPRKQQGPTTAHRFRVTVDWDVPPGTYDLRVVNKWGVSNPRAFVVGELPEVTEKEPNNDVPEAQRVEIGTTVNGVIQSGTDVDYTVFAARKGQRVVVHCRASSIDSRARPMVEVFDVAGKKLTQNRGVRDADAVADLTIPADGDYYVRLSEFTYQSGSPDHVYRLTISSAPWIDAVFPPAIEPGKPARVTLYGCNLPGGEPADGFTIDGRSLEKLTVTVTPPKGPQAATRLTLRDRIDPAIALQDGFEYRLRGPGGFSNPVPIFLAREKVVTKQNTGGTRPETAEPIPAPCEVAGMIHKKGDRDWYRFEAKKGEVFLVELLGERIGSPTDFYFSVVNPANKNQDLSGEQDDDPDSLHPVEFFTRTSDPPTYRFTAPADGNYLVAVGSRESAFLTGPQTIYRLRVSPPRPDFRVVVKPFTRSYQTGSAGRQGGTEAFEVFVHRIDGFIGPVTVTAGGLPAGVTAKPTMIGPAARWGILVLSIDPSAEAYTGPITVTATAEVDSKTLTREARPASVTWGSPLGSNVPVVARLDRSLVLAVRPEPAFFGLTPDVGKATVRAGGKDEKRPAPLAVKQGENLILPVKATWTGSDKPNVTVAADPMAPNPQANPVTVQPGMQLTKDNPEGTVTINVRANAPPGTYSVVLRGESQVPFAKDPNAKKGNVSAVAFAEPVVLTVLPTALARVTAGQLPNNTLKLGQTAELTVKVERQFDFAGEFTVTFEAPKGVAGVTAEAVVIPAGKSEAKLVLTADEEEARPGAVNGAIVRVTAVYAGKHTITHETKVNFTVAK